MTEFETDSITLSLRNAETGRPLTANVYNVTFDDGSVRTMSMGQLVAALCLDKATEKEEQIIEIMEEMARTTANIEALSDIEAKLVEEGSSAQLSDIAGSWTFYNPTTGEETTLTDARLVVQGLGIGGFDPQDADSVISALESKLDELNTQSQEQLITLQSETNKRDQRYEMTTNVLKSLYTVMCGVANNI